MMTKMTIKYLTLMKYHTEGLYKFTLLIPTTTLLDRVINPLSLLRNKVKVI
jgi:hypothetical protein